MEKEIKSKKKKDSGITLIALVITIIVLIILAGVSINLVLGNNGIITRAREARNNYQKAAAEEETALKDLDKLIDETTGSSGGDTTKDIPKNDDGKISEGITYTDSDNKTQTLTKDTAAGTKIGTTAVDGQTLDWYLFDVSNDGKTAYLVSTPTYWVPDTTKEVNGAYTPKLVSAYDSKTGAMNQAIQKKPSATSGNYSYSYSSGNVTYKPSDNTLNYYKSANPQWNTNRGSVDFKSLNENEQSACYLADADIFAGIKDQVNNAEGNLKGKIQTLVGGASVEQWCKAYNKQSGSSKITCAYQETNTPGYIYKVNGTAQNSGWYTNNKTIVGNDIYGAAYTYNRSNNSTYPFSSCYWWLASPSAFSSIGVCYVTGGYSRLRYTNSYGYDGRFSLFASVSL